MRTFLKTIIAFFGIISLIILVFLSAITFLFLNPNFYMKSLSKPGIYKNIEKGLKASARDTLKLQLTGETIEYDKLSVGRSEEHTSELQSRLHLVCRLLL